MAGVTRFRLSPVYRAPRRPVVVPAGRGPGAARERFARPPAGTALAPHLDRIRNAPFDERDSMHYVTATETIVKRSVTVSATPSARQRIVHPQHATRLVRQLDGRSFAVAEVQALDSRLPAKEFGSRHVHAAMASGSSDNALKPDVVLKHQNRRD
jgi:hypothetical protein